MTYAALKTDIETYLHRTDLTSLIPGFIKGVENDLAYGVDLPTIKVSPLRIADMETKTTQSISSQYEDWPTDALEITNMQINVDTYVYSLKYLTPEQIDERWMGSTSNQPIVFTHIGRQFQFAPSPNATYSCEIAYYKKYTAFSGDSDTNWLLTNHSFVYLYGALAHAQDYMENNEQADRWFAKYASLVKGLNGMEQFSRFSGASLRVQA